MIWYNNIDKAAQFLLYLNHMVLASEKQTRWFCSANANSTFERSSKLYSAKFFWLSSIIDSNIPSKWCKLANIPEKKIINETIGRVKWIQSSNSAVIKIFPRGSNLYSRKLALKDAHTHFKWTSYLLSSLETFPREVWLE